MEFLKRPQEVIRNDGISTNQRISLNINPLVVAPGPADRHLVNCVVKKKRKKGSGSLKIYLTPSSLPFI